MSLYFDGTGDYLRIPDSDDWAFGSNDYTIDFWVRLASLPSQQFLFNIRVDGNHAYEASIDSSGNIKWLAWDGSQLFDFTRSTGLAIDTWAHIAFISDNNELKIYKDGQLQGTSQAFAGSIPNYAAPFDIGQWSGGGIYFNGYMQEFRISDTARWTSNFTPETGPFSSDANTKLLLHMNGDVSNSEHPITLISTPQLDATTTKFDGAMYFDGIGDYLTIPDSDDFNFGSDNFTIDLWASLDSGLTHQFCRQGPPSGNDSNNIVWMVGSDKTITLLYSVSGTGWVTVNSTVAATFNYNEWTHFAVVRNSTLLTFYVNGTKVGDSIDIGTAIFYNSSSLFTIGAGTSGGIFVNALKGYIDELRISKGIARWTSNFTPETGPYFRVGVSLFDFTTFTEVDPSNDLIVTADAINIDAMTRNVSAGVYKDFGVDYFSGDFEFEWDFDFTAEVGSYGAASIFALTPNYLLTRDNRDTGNSGLDVYIGIDTGSAIMTFLRDWVNNSNDASNSVYNVPQRFWYNLTRVGSTVTLKIYTDSDRTILYDTLIISNSAVPSYRYLYAMTSFGSSFAPTDTLSGDLRNLIQLG